MPLEQEGSAQDNWAGLAPAGAVAAQLALQHDWCPSRSPPIDEVFDGPLSRAIDQAESRMHAIKVLMVSRV